MRPITATDLMNSDVLTVRDDLPVSELADFLIDNDITGAPVVDRQGSLVGVVSLVDIVALDVDDDEDLSVADIMSPEVVSVEEDATVSEIALKMLRDHLHRVLVMRDGEILGIISTSDLLGLLVDVE